MKFHTQRNKKIVLGRPHAGVWIENNSIIGIGAVISSCAQGKGIDMNYATQGADVSSAALDG